MARDLHVNYLKVDQNTKNSTTLKYEGKLSLVNVLGANFILKKTFRSSNFQLIFDIRVEGLRVIFLHFLSKCLKYHEFIHFSFYS